MCSESTLILNKYNSSHNASCTRYCTQRPAMGLCMGKTQYLTSGIVISQWMDIICDRRPGTGDSRRARTTLEVIIQSFNKHILGVYYVINVMCDVRGISDQHDRHCHLRTSFTGDSKPAYGIVVMGQTPVLLGRRTRKRSEFPLLDCDR